jgi:hypothetical protein
MKMHDRSIQHSRGSSDFNQMPSRARVGLVMPSMITMDEAAPHEAHWTFHALQSVE